MRRAVFAVVVILLLAPLTSPSLAWDSSSDLLFVPRPPIVIQGEADFTPENGVRRGTGTAEDPYHITGWLVASDLAIVIENTRSHVILADNHLTLTHLQPGPGVALYVSNATNLTIQNNLITATAHGIEVWGQSNVSIIGNIVRGNQATGGSVWTSLSGISVVESSAWIQDNTVDRFVSGISVGLYTKTIVVENNKVRDSIQGISIYADGPVDVINNSVVNGKTGIIVTNAAGLLIKGNEFRHLVRGFDIYADHPRTTRNVSVHDNVVSGTSGQEFIFDCQGCRFTHNVFERMGEGLGMASPAEVTNNTFRLNNVAIGTDTNELARIHNNSFSVTNRVLAVATAGEVLDLRHNWWGNPTGPDETRLVREGGDFLVAPWLVEPPGPAP